LLILILPILIHLGHKYYKKRKKSFGFWRKV
jgi:hypothetical protein